MNKNKRNRLIQGQDFSLLEIRPNKYVKVINGEIVGRPSEEDKSKVLVTSQIGEIDIGVVEVGLAFCAISAILTSSEFDIIVRIISLSMFCISCYSSGVIYYTYLLQKFPEFNLFLEENDRDVKLIVDYYFSLFVNVIIRQKHMDNEFLRKQLLFAYLTFLGVSVVISLLVALILFESLGIKQLALSPT